MENTILKGLSIMQMIREDTLNKTTSSAEKLFFWLLDNYVLMQNGELTNEQISKLNSIAPNWMEHVEKSAINAYYQIVGA